MVLRPSRGRGAEIFEVLEVPNWAPWLRFSAEELDAQAEVFSAGQILLCDERDRPLASLSTNRVHWNGVVDDLPTWDDVSGEARTYRHTYSPTGNAIVLMSVNVRPDARGERHTDVLVEAIRKVAIASGIEHILSDFRPSDYGSHKLERGDLAFEAYCLMTRADGLPVDAWLRSLVRKGMQPLRIDPRAMIVTASRGELDEYKASYNPDRWRAVTEPNALSMRGAEHTPRLDLGSVDEVWECGETGTWYVDRSADEAVYVESNLWGRLPAS